jgi:hypothetical protein
MRSFIATRGRSHRSRHGPSISPGRSQERTRKAAPLFFNALKSGPLPGYLMEAARRQTLVRLTLRQWENHQPVSAAGFALFEPWPMWNREHLKTATPFTKRPASRYRPGSP